MAVEIRSNHTVHVTVLYNYIYYKYRYIAPVIRKGIFRKYNNIIQNIYYLC